MTMCRRAQYLATSVAKKPDSVLSKEKPPRLEDLRVVLYIGYRMETRLCPKGIVLRNIHPTRKPIWCPCERKYYVQSLRCIVIFRLHYHGDEHLGTRVNITIDISQMFMQFFLSNALEKGNTTMNRDRMRRELAEEWPLGKTENAPSEYVPAKKSLLGTVQNRRLHLALWIENTTGQTKRKQYELCSTMHTCITCLGTSSVCF